MKVYFTFIRNRAGFQTRYCIDHRVYDLKGNCIASFEHTMTQGPSTYKKKVAEITRSYDVDRKSLVFLGATW
jgi:dTDP-D-glucose 4,6-dehydratase